MAKNASDPNNVSLNRVIFFPLWIPVVSALLMVCLFGFAIVSVVQSDQRSIDFYKAFNH